MIKILFMCIAAVLIGISLLYSIYVTGLILRLTVRKLNAAEIEAIKKEGIIHFTSDEGLKGILSEKKVNAKKDFDSRYIYHTKKVCYFLSNTLAKSDKYILEYNWKPRFKHCITIMNLTDDQIKNLRIRERDFALIYIEDFIICAGNNVKSVCVTKESMGISKGSGVIGLLRYIGCCILTLSMGPGCMFFLMMAVNYLLFGIQK